MIEIGIIIFVIVYIISAYISWKYIHIAYSKGGRYQASPVDSDEVCLVFVPFANTLFGIISWSIYPPIEKNDKNLNFYKKFFKIER